MSLERCDLDGFGGIASEWDQVAARSGSPFLTAAWVESWWRAIAPEAFALLLRGEDGALRAGGLFVESRGALRAAVNDHTPDWGPIAVDAAARGSFWSEVASLGHGRLVLGPLLGDGEPVAAPREALAEAGYRLAEEALEPSPLLELGASTFDELFAARSGKLRAQIRRGRRGLEEQGELATRTVLGGEELEQALEAFFALEGAGWKGEEGTAIATDPALLELYRGFARTAAAQGWMRMYLLELNGKLVAADYGCVFDGCGYRIKTTFDEDMRRFAPGLVLLTDVLQFSIDEGLDRYDFLGGPDEYKLRWTDRMREHTVLHAFRGGAAMPAYAWRNRVRPALKRGRDRLRGAER
jgi:CelD/BcsL family acetyltransferase involved in cellulose biosynthesis